MKTLVMANYIRTFTAPLNTDAVISVFDFNFGKDGLFVLPAGV